VDAPKTNPAGAGSMVTIKGTVVLDSIRAVKEREGEAVYTKIIRLLDEETRRVFESGIFDTAWYPLDAFVRFLAADLQETAGGNERVLIARSEVVVEKQLSGIYRVFARLSSAEAVIRRLTGIHRTYFEGVQINFKTTGSTQATVRYVGFEPQHRLMEYPLIGFYRKALELSGAKQVSTGFTTSRGQGRGYWELALNWR
jgi:hypothetical protein